MGERNFLNVGPESSRANNPAGDRYGFSEPSDITNSFKEGGLHFGPQADGRVRVLEFEQTLSALAAISTDLGKNFSGIIIAVQLIIETLVVAGGNSVKVGLGPIGDPDKYGKTADLLADTTVETLITPTAPVSAEDIQVHLVQTGGGIGTTTATAGKVRVRITYWSIAALNA